MKTIILVRHGKSSWEHDVTDRERPLKTRGINDAGLVVAEFLKKNNIPKHIFSSPANRALSTCRIFTNSFNFTEDSINIIEELYDFGGENVINFVKNLPNEYNDIMIFGHNHAFTSIANGFGDRYIGNLPTSGLVKISFNSEDWKGVENGKTELIIFPRELKQ